MTAAAGRVRPKGRRTVTAVVLMMTTALTAVGGALPSAAKESKDSQLTQAAQRDFNIPPQPLTSALAQFGQQSGLQITVDGALVRDLATQGVRGTMNADQALQLLLAGTGLTYGIVGGTTITLQRLARLPGDPVQLDPVVVEARRAVPWQAEIGNLPPEFAGGQVARGGRLGLLGNRDVMDTPFNQTSYTAQTIQNQQARSVADVANNDPSVRSSWPATGFSAPLMIRGFPASNQDIAFGGLYGVAPAFTVGTEIAERVEILKGPGAMLTGIQPNGSVGGAVNIVPKRAGDTPITQLTTSYLSDAQFGGHIDVARRFGTDNQVGIRFNGVYRDGDTAVDDQSQQLAVAVAGIDFRGERVRLSVDLGYQKQNMDAPSLVTYVSPGIPVPRAPDASSNWYQRWSQIEIEDKFGALRGEVDLSPDWTAFAAAGGRDTPYERWAYFPTVTNAAGNLTGNAARLELHYVTNTEEAGLRGRFDTGPVDHQITVGASRFHQRTESLTVTRPGAIVSNLYNPVSVADPGTTDIDPPKTSESNLTSLALGDVLSVLDERVQLIMGVRQQQIHSRNYSATTGAMTSRYAESALTPAAGLVVKPWRNVSLYGNYVEGLQQGAVVGGTYANAGQVLAPYTSKQYEAGVKVDWGGFATTFAAFQIAQPSATAPSSTGLLSTDGEQRNRGLEFNIFGQVSESVRLLGGVSLIDATLTKTANGTNDGKTATGVPELQINVGGEWDTPFVPGLTVSGRVIYTSSQYLDNANTQSIPAWTRFDLGARYRLETRGTPITIRANVENVFDKDYWASSAYFQNWLASGAPRTFLLSTTFDF